MSEEKVKKPSLTKCLAHVLTKLYKEKGLTQEGIAKQAGIARGTVIRAITLGRVTIPNLQRICAVIGMAVSDVFKAAELERKNAPK